VGHAEGGCFAMAVNAYQNPRRISILGATGSIGLNTIDLIQSQPEKFDVIALSANKNVEKLATAARQLNAEFAAVADTASYAALKEALAGTGIEAAAGPDAVIEAARREADIVVSAIVGSAGLAPTLAAIESGSTIALANKESLVCAGHLMMDACRQNNATLLPVDSEHNAIFQVFDAAQKDRISRLILTASGGPFRTMELARMASITPEQAVAHPNWSMGAKISVDSATMMNKGLEVIEAHYLFDMPIAQIDVVVHPQSVVHSMVEYIDGSVLSQMGAPDMRTPIAYALAWPDRMATSGQKLDMLSGNMTLTFEPPDDERFPALELARAALQNGGTHPTILNSANEIAVDAFLGRQINYLDIVAVVGKTLDALPARQVSCLGDIFEVDRMARKTAQDIINKHITRKMA